MEDADGITLRIPARTVLQLYHDGTLSANRSESVELSIADKNLGGFYVQWLRCLPDMGFGDPVLLRLARVPCPAKKPEDPRAWLHELVPLQLHSRGMWDPEEEYWGEPGEPIEEWAKPIIARGPRPMYEMEQVLPGADPDDPDSDPILRANALRDAGRKARARQALERLLIKDMRCLDAHAHLGNLVFAADPHSALWHYERGVLIGRLSLKEDFDGVLPWGLIDNRPFLRCLQGLGLCLWRLRRFEEAETLFNQMLWLSPSDNLGVRFLLPRVRAGGEWTDSD
jgi:tetratricopeptide (TPR) repeat protein